MSQHTTGPDETEAGPVHTTVTPEADTAASHDQSTTDQAKEAAKGTVESAQQKAHDLAGTAKQEVGHVAHTATTQLRQLFDQSRGELTDQAQSQQQRLSKSLRTLTDELDQMADSSEQSGMAQSVVRQLSEHARNLGDWLERSEPSDVLDEVSRFARRKPGTFLAVAAGIGFLSGRLTRGLTGDDEKPSNAPHDGAGHRVSGEQPVAAGHPVPAADVEVTRTVGPLATTGTTAGVDR